jgi:MFS transporter, UMF1 family
MAHAEEARAPRYDGEDISPTTDREIRGWFFTGLAAEIYAVCGVGKVRAPESLTDMADCIRFLCTGPP